MTVLPQDTPQFFYIINMYKKQSRTFWYGLLVNHRAPQEHNVILQGAAPNTVTDHVQRSSYSLTTTTRLHPKPQAEDTNSECLQCFHEILNQQNIGMAAESAMLTFDRMV